MDPAKRIEYGSHAKHDKEHRNIASRGQWETAARMFNMIMNGHIRKGARKTHWRPQSTRGRNLSKTYGKLALSCSIIATSISKISQQPA